MLYEVITEEIIETGKRTTIDLGIHGLHPELIRIVGKMKYRSSYGQNLLQHSREVANLAAIMASELGLNPNRITSYNVCYTKLLRTTANCRPDTVDQIGNTN